MSLEQVNLALAKAAAKGKEGLAITVLHKGKVYGIDICPDWERDYKRYSFSDFAEMYLRPAFAHLAIEMEDQDGSS